MKLIDVSLLGMRESVILVVEWWHFTDRSGHDKTRTHRKSRPEALLGTSRSLEETTVLKGRKEVHNV